MKIIPSKLEELKDSECRGSRAIYSAITDVKIKPTIVNLLPFVTGAYQTGKHRSGSYIKREIKDTLKWLQRK